MSDEPPRKGSAIWAMLLAVAVAWSACGAYRWRVPPIMEARAIVRVPAATDLESLCHLPDVLQQVSDQIPDLEPTAERPRLSGVVTAKKVSNGQRAASSKSDSSDVTSQATRREASHVATETWELTYQTPQESRGIEELSTLLTVLEQRVMQAAKDAQASESPDESASQVPEIESKLSRVEDALQGLLVVDPVDMAARAERIQTLEREQAAALRQQVQFTEDWAALSRGLRSGIQLAAVAEQVPPGQVQEALLKLDGQQQMSAELRRLNETEQQLEAIYGDRHPKLVELRSKFEQLLTKLGGWDEIVDKGQVAERLRSWHESTLATQQDQMADLALRLELETEELTRERGSTEQHSALSAERETLRQALAVAQQASQQTSTGSSSALTVIQQPAIANLPWYSSTVTLYCLATICGLALGRTIHRAWPVADDVDEDEREISPAPVYIAAAMPQLDLAQRRALRQARLQQAYA